VLSQLSLLLFTRMDLHDVIYMAVKSDRSCLFILMNAGILTIKPVTFFFKEVEESL